MISKINEMGLIQFVSLYKNMSTNERINIINDKDITNLTNEKFNIIVLNSNVEEFKVLLSNEELYDKLMNTPSNTRTRSVLDILSEKIEIFKLLIESPYACKYSSKFIEFISHLNGKKLNDITLINFENAINGSLNKDFLKNYLKEKLVDKDDNFDDVFELFMTKISKINPLLVFRVKSYMQFVLLAKFGTLIDVEYNSQNIILPSKTVIPYETVIDIKDKYITKLMDMLKQKGDAEPYKYLEVALKLYLIFGFDDSKKIIEDKFSKLNENSLARIVDFNFKDARREYRAKNQSKFYFYSMEKQAIEAINNNDDTFFINLLDDSNEINKLKNELKEIINEFEENESTLKIKEKLCLAITERENIKKNKMHQEIKKRIDEKNKYYSGVDTELLFNLLRDVDLYQIQEYNSIILSKLQTFLLGNKKANNDCLFRLILNEEAFGLNRNLSNLINNFDVINAIAASTDLSLNSILDVIDILKVNLYELKPNERDIELETFTRVINSPEYRTDNTVDVAKEICRIHVERKNKTYSTIPTIEGKTDDFEYFVAPFDAEYLLAAGNDGRNCLRIAGLGQDFFEYCLKNKNAVMIYLIGKDGTKYVCPTIRSGNAINCNGIDPEVPEECRSKVLTALSRCFKQIIDESFKSDRPHYENIEIGTVTNLHLEDYFKSLDIKKYDLKHALPLDQPCYCDYHKKEITNYVIAKSETYKEDKYYISSDEFYQKRDQNYEFDVNKEYDKERLSIIINSIYYSSIDYQNITPEEKIRRKREFELLDINSFKYITGNKDWFVAIDDNYNILSRLLPYDKRAKIDYLKAVMQVPLILEKIKEDNYGRKNI